MQLCGRFAVMDKADLTDMSKIREDVRLAGIDAESCRICDDRIWSQKTKREQSDLVCLHSYGKAIMYANIEIGESYTSVR